MSLVRKGLKPISYCPKCNSQLLTDEHEHVDEHSLVVHRFCADCDFRLSELYKFIDWEETGYARPTSHFAQKQRCSHVFDKRVADQFICSKCGTPAH